MSWKTCMAVASVALLASCSAIVPPMNRQAANGTTHKEVAIKTAPTPVPKEAPLPSHQSLGNKFAAILPSHSAKEPTVKNLSATTVWNLRDSKQLVTWYQIARHYTPEQPSARDYPSWKVQCAAKAADWRSNGGPFATAEGTFVGIVPNEPGAMACMIDTASDQTATAFCGELGETMTGFDNAKHLIVCRKEGDTP